MRKYFLVFVLILMFAVISNKDIKAQENNLDEPITNLLHLKSLSFISGQYMFEQEIDLEVGKTYSFFIQPSIYGENGSWQMKPTDTDEVIVIEYQSGKREGYDLKTYENTPYIDFIASENKLVKIMAYHQSTHHSYDPKFVLYEGDANLFPGFINFSDEGIYEKDDNKLVYLMAKGSDLTLEEIKDKIKVREDNFYVLNFNLIEDTYTNSDKDYGTYKAVYLLYNESNSYIRSKLYLDIVVMDSKPATIEGPDQVEVIRSDDFSVESLLTHYEMTDNDPINPDLSIEFDYFDINTLGNYFGVVFGHDYEGNRVEKQIEAIVVDKTKPTIKPLAELLYSYNDLSPFTEEEIISYFEISDDSPYEDLVITLKDSNNYFTNYQTVGEYPFIIEVKDPSNNISRSSISIRVIRRSGIQISYDDRFILTFASYNQMNEQEIKEWFINKLKEEGVSASNIELINTNYELDSKAGQYYAHFSYNVGDEEYRERMLINVLDEQNKNLSTTQILLIVIGALIIIGGAGYGSYYYIRKKKKYS